MCFLLGNVSFQRVVFIDYKMLRAIAIWIELLTITFCCDSMRKNLQYLICMQISKITWHNSGFISSIYQCECIALLKAMWLGNPYGEQILVIYYLTLIFLVKFRHIFISIDSSVNSSLDKSLWEIIFEYIYP